MRASLLFLILLLYASIDGAIVRKAAFDLGSGKIKCLVADIEEEKKEIISILFSENILIGLQEDLEKNGGEIFSSEILDELEEKIGQLKKKADCFHPQSYSSVATEAYRKASNGKSAIDRINRRLQINARVISQTEEALLGLFNASLLAKREASSIIAFDIGGGSFQLISNNFLYGGSLGKIPCKKILLEIQGKSLESLSPNPVTIEEIDRTIKAIEKRLEAYPKELEDLSSKKVIGIGAMHIYLQDALGKSSYTKDEVLSTLKKYANLKDSEIDEDIQRASFRISDLSFIYAVMNYFGIDEIQYIRSNGNTSAILLSE